MIEFSCKCGRRVSIADKFAGRVVTCPGCSARLPVPVPQPDPALAGLVDTTEPAAPDEPAAVPGGSPVEAEILRLLARIERHTYWTRMALWIPVYLALASAVVWAGLRRITE